MGQKWHTKQIEEFDVEYTGAMAGLFDMDQYADTALPALNPGGVFIYLFRRFGYPRIGWDGRKELVQYYLTTPMEGVLLSVRPNVTGGGTFGYMLRIDLDLECNNDVMKPMDDWRKRFDAWALKEHGVEILNMFEQNSDKLDRAWVVWGEDKQHIEFGSEKDAYNAFYDDQEQMRIKYVDMYEEIDPYPKRVSVEDRNDDSILKQCHTALCSAIDDLLCPVYVRDVLLNIVGVVPWDPEQDPDANMVPYTPVAGHGVGDVLDNIWNSS